MRETSIRHRRRCRRCLHERRRRRRRRKGVRKFDDTAHTYTHIVAFPLVLYVFFPVMLIHEDKSPACHSSLERCYCILIRGTFDELSLDDSGWTSVYLKILIRYNVFVVCVIRYLNFTRGSPKNRFSLNFLKHRWHTPIYIFYRFLKPPV